MIKAIAVITKGGKTEILEVGRVGECRAVALKAGLAISPMGSAVVQVFSECSYNDDGRKADYQRRLEADEKATRAAGESLTEEAPAKSAAKVAKKKAGKG